MPAERTDSVKTFDDGAHCRIEIPSVETPEQLRLVLRTAEDLGVPVHRVSQGSGVFMLTDDELAEFAVIGREHRVEVCLFARPTAVWDNGAGARAAAGALFAGACRGDQLTAALADISRAVGHGIRSVLISDLGLLAEAARQRARGVLPSGLRFKVSASLAVCNHATARVLEDLGADTINVASDLSLSALADIRAEVAVPLDMYIESPGELGGMVRHWQTSEIARAAAPVHLKFGVSNAPDPYPYGEHHQELAARLAVERVRRARLAVEAVRRGGLPLAFSPTDTHRAGVPVPAE